MEWFSPSGSSPASRSGRPDAFDDWTESFLANLNPVSEERRKLTRYFAGNSFDASSTRPAG